MRWFIVAFFLLLFVPFASAGDRIFFRRQAQPIHAQAVGVPVHNGHAGLQYERTYGYSYSYPDIQISYPINVGYYETYQYAYPEVPTMNVKVYQNPVAIAPIALPAFLDPAQAVPPPSYVVPQQAQAPVALNPAAIATPIYPSPYAPYSYSRDYGPKHPVEIQRAAQQAIQRAGYRR